MIVAPATAHFLARLAKIDSAKLERRLVLVAGALQASDTDGWREALASRVAKRVKGLRAGEGVGMGKDDTLFAKAAGTVVFATGRRGRVVSVAPDAADTAA